MMTCADETNEGDILDARLLLDNQDLPLDSTPLQRNILMTQKDHFVWQKLQRHFNTDDLTIVVSSRWKFTAHLLPDLQSNIEELIASRSPELFGFHQFESGLR
ncbi:hypothetical protein U8Q05_31035 (plasmid) [Rhizobium ruizarguesonis]|nr:hypothetical protein U8Q05_31035 [Rhizobium ruizarguesonis]